MILLAALLMVAAQPRAAAKVVPPDAEWLTGIWIEKDATRSLDRCASWDAVGFYADGSVSQFDWDGRWRLEGNRLIEEPREDAEPRRLVSRVVRVGPNELKRIGPDGKAVVILRCPKPETPSAL